MSGLSGAEGLVKRMNKYSADIQNEVKGIIEYYTGEIEREAIANAPGPGDMISTEHGPVRQGDISENRRGNLVPISQAIGYEIKSSGYTGIVFVDSSAGDLAVYVEMGTGQSAKSYLADKPAEWKAFAMRYYVNGQGTIVAQPYLLPAFMRNQLLAVKELRELLKNKKL